MEKTKDDPIGGLGLLRLLEEEEQERNRIELQSLNLETDYGFAKFVQIRRKKGLENGVPWGIPEPKIEFWRPTEKYWLPIDDAISELLARQAKPRIDLTDALWTSGIDAFGPHVRVRVLLESELEERTFTQPEFLRKFYSKKDMDRIEELGDIQTAIAQFLEAALGPHCSFHRDLAWKPWQPYHIAKRRFPENYESLFCGPEVVRQKDLLKERSYSRSIEDLKRAYAAATSLRELVETRVKEVSASTKTKPNFAKRDFVKCIGSIWANIGCSPSSSPDSLFSNFVTACWNSIVTDPPEISFERTIREVVKQEKI